MVKYAYTPSTQHARAQAPALATSFKKMHETGKVLVGMSLVKAYEFLNAVLEHKRAVPFRRFNGGVGRCAQAKEWGITQARWPVKSVRHMIDLLRNCESSAKSKDMDVKSLYVKCVQVNQAPKRRRRTYRAHGRITPYLSHPCHVQVILANRPNVVPKAKKLE